MVDVVVNNVMSTSLTPDLSTYMFNDQVSFTPSVCFRCTITNDMQSQYHPYCPIQWGNHTSEQNCWLGDTKVPLPDVNTQDPTVVSGYSQWIKSLVQTYNIDGLRIDAAK
jgi:alpha-amylase